MGRYRLVVPREDMTKAQRETLLAPEEEKILKQAHDIAEKKKRRK